MDLNYDDQCQDAFYCLKNVSYTGTGLSGFYGLSSPGISTGRGGADNFLFHGKVMVWSVGPDGRVDAGVKATSGLNKDNILSWH
jgi:hypothetical protein